MEFVKWDFCSQYDGKNHIKFIFQSPPPTSTNPPTHLPHHVPSGEHTNSNWKWPSRNSGFSQLQNGGSFHYYISSPEGIPYINSILPANGNGYKYNIHWWVITIVIWLYHWWYWCFFFRGTQWLPAPCIRAFPPACWSCWAPPLRSGRRFLSDFSQQNHGKMVRYNHGKTMGINKETGFPWILIKYINQQL